MSNALIHFNAARYELAKASTVDEVKAIRDKAEALRAYAKQAGESLEMQNQCAAIKLRAERKAGEMLKEIERGDAGRPARNSSHDGTNFEKVISDIGVKKSQAYRWQSLADLPQDDFEEYIEEVVQSEKELTTAGALRLVQEHKRETKQQAAEELKEKASVAHSETLSLVSSPPPAVDVSLLWQNQIFTGDARDVLPKVPRETVDLVLTDPPYNIGFNAYDLHDDSMPVDEYIALLKMLQRFSRIVVIQYPEESARFVYPALGAPDHVGAWCYNSQLPRRFRLINYYGLKPDYSRIRQPYKNLDDKRIRARLENGAEGSPLYEWWDDIQLVKNVSKEKGSHPCPVPVRLMERIILLCTEQGDTVLDPFIGEGTTADAAQRNGRNYIGIELSPNYADAARERLQAFQPQLAER